ncbi:hypothetical protein [Flavivirga algicola]|uniref:Lipoprotein n=1 Tax=Flavivirga algicola TaxID=2729136 RepID=A0ABX1S3X7_9FLAO|nr:hypothetical protein [Flavivirga algicola]NMH89758.1 hypothetical protein [Flavivirga algicola]
MKKIFLPVLLLLLIISSCKNDDDNSNTTCNVSNPVEDLTWLKEIIEDFKQSTLVDESYVYKATYEGKTVFIIGNCCATCNSLTLVAYCNGDFVFNLDNKNDKDAYNNFLASYEGHLIWSSPNFVCNN